MTGDRDKDKDDGIRGLMICAHLYTFREREFRA